MAGATIRKISEPIRERTFVGEVGAFAHALLQPVECPSDIFGALGLEQLAAQVGQALLGMSAWRPADRGRDGYGDDPDPTGRAHRGPPAWTAA